MSASELRNLNLNQMDRDKFIRRIFGSAEFVRGIVRHCLWIEDSELGAALEIPAIAERVAGARQMRLDSPDSGANKMADRPHQMREMNIAKHMTVTVPRTSSVSRPFLPNGIIDSRCTVTSEAYALWDAPLWTVGLISSRIHLMWVATVCGKLKTDYRYSNTMGWNTFPIPTLTSQNKADLTLTAERILLAREAHFPASIADLYNPETMPQDLKEAHERNDETLERIYIGRRFKNDTERLEKLFEMYTKMTSKDSE